MPRTAIRTMRRSSFAALFCLALPVCGGDTAAMAGEGGDCEGLTSGNGEFELVVTGPKPAEECGHAVSAEDPSGPGWGVQLQSTSNISQINFWSEFNGRPDPGTYAIGDFVATDGSPASGNFVMFSIFDQETVGEALTSVTGTLTILTSSADEVTGTFEISARAGTLAGVAADYDVSGSFTAANEDA